MKLLLYGHSRVSRFKQYLDNNGIPTCLPLSEDEIVCWKTPTLKDSLENYQFALNNVKEQHASFDYILIFLGGDDITSWNDKETIKSDIMRLNKEAKKIYPMATVCFALIERRFYDGTVNGLTSSEFETTAKSINKYMGRQVNINRIQRLFMNRGDTIFPEWFYESDAIHLNDDGYARLTEMLSDFVHM